MPKRYHGELRNSTVKNKIFIIGTHGKIAVMAQTSKARALWLKISHRSPLPF
jgi:hypothetical protein